MGEEEKRLERELASVEGDIVELKAPRVVVPMEMASSDNASVKTGKSFGCKNGSPIRLRLKFPWSAKSEFRRSIRNALRNLRSSTL